MTTASQVAVYDADRADEGCLASWSFLAGSDAVNTTPAIFAGGRFFVAQKHEMVHWMDGESSLDSAARQSFDAPVARLTTHRRYPDHVVVVLEDGNINVLNVATFVLRTPAPQQSRTRRQSNVLSSSSKLTSVASYKPSRAHATVDKVVSVQLLQDDLICTLRLKSGQYANRMFRINVVRTGGVGSDSTATITLSATYDIPSPFSSEMALKSCTWHSDGLVSVLWNDNTWDVLKRDETRHVLSSLRQYRFRGRVSDVVAVGPHLLVLSESNAACLTAWSPRHGVVFSSDVHDNDKISSTGILSQAPDAQRVAYVVGSDVVVRPMRCVTPSLASLLGQMNRSKAFLHDVDATRAINASDVGRSACILASPCPLTFRDDQEEAKAMEDVRRAWSEGRSSFEKTFKKHASNDRLCTSLKFVNEVMRLSLKDTENPVWVPIQTFLSKNVISSTSCPGLLTVLMRHEKLDLLSSALRHVADITEFDLVRVLIFALRDVSENALCELDDSRTNFALSAPTTKTTKKTKKGKDKSVTKKRQSSSTFDRPLKRRKTGALRSVAYLVKAVVTSTFDDEFMSAALRQLNLSEVCLLLSMLSAWLSKDRKFAGGPGPNDQHCCRMIEVLIDSHFMSLRLAMQRRDGDKTSTTIAELLVDLAEIVTSRTRACDYLAPLSGYLYQLGNGSSGPRVKPDYAIEVLSL